MSKHLGTVTNLELRESNPDGTEGAGLSHTAEGLHLLHVYEIAGAGEPRGGVTIVHDLGEHGGRYVELADRLVDDDWALALPDLRGHGESEGPRGHSWGLPEPVRDIQSVQDHVAYRLPDHPKVLVGIGVGALYGLAFARSQPDGLQALVLIGPVLAPELTPPPAPGGLKKLFAKPRPTDPGELGWPPERRFRSPEAQRAFAADRLCHDQLTRHTAQNLPREAAELFGHLGAIRVPMLVIHGSEDRIVPPAASEVLASAERRVIEGAGHGVLHEPGATELIDEIARWIDGRCPR